MRKKEAEEHEKVDFNKVGGVTNWWSNFVGNATEKSDIDKVREQYNKKKNG